MGIFTYENQGANTFLIYTADSGEETDSVAVGMTANNKLEGIISPGIQQKNMKMVYKYNITSLTALADVLLSVLTGKKLVMLFESMTKGILSAQQYLLTEDNFLLDTAHIYVNVSSGEASMIVSPVVKNGGISYQNFLKEILNSVISDETEDCTYLVKIRNYVNRREGFTYEGLLDTLGKLTIMNNSVYARTDIPARPVPAPAVQEPAPAAVPPVLEKSKTAYEIPVSAPVSSSAAPVNPQQNDIPVSGRAAKPAKEKGFGFGKLFGKKDKGKSEKQENSAPLSFAYPGKSSEQEAPVGSMAVPEQNNRNIPPVPPQQIPLEADYGNTVLMDDDDDASTVLLSGEDTLLQHVGEHGHRVYITREKNQQKMEIAKPVFKIGRSADTADFYVAGNGMVGREHAFILQDGGSVYIKDNNSKNHTFVNDVMVGAGEKIELKNEDIIRIADEPFKISIQ